MPFARFPLAFPFRSHVLPALLVVGACAAPPKPPAASPEPPAVAQEAPASPLVEEEEEKAAVPTPPPVASFPDRCADEGAPGICSPPLTFARDICGGFARPEIALKLFAKGSPWTRAYLRLNVDGWYAGGHSARVALKFDEEVVVLHHPNPKGGIVINDSG